MHRPMKLFLDTEFTQLDWTAKLISVAVVDENEDTFYVELTDNYELEDCSSFVHEHVLPYLDHGPRITMTYNEACARLAQWIEDRNVPTVFATDAPHWDIRLVYPMLEQIWPSNLVFDSELITVPCNVSNSLFKKYNLTPHFAPHDALVNKRAIIG